MFPETRTPAQRRAATFVAPAIFMATLLFALAGALLPVRGRDWVLPVVFATLAMPVIALWTFASAGASLRRALLIGAAGGVLIAVVYGLVFILPAPPRW
jgi:hypothetical protein